MYLIKETAVNRLLVIWSQGVGGREASSSQMISSHLFDEPEPLNSELPQCFSVFVFSLQVEQNSYRGLELGISLSLSRLGSDKPQ